MIPGPTPNILSTWCWSAITSGGLPRAKLLATVKPGGLLLYETFMAGNKMYGKPSRPEFLLRPNELAQWVYGDFRVIAFDQMPGAARTANQSP